MSANEAIQKFDALAAENPNTLLEKQLKCLTKAKEFLNSDMKGAMFSNDEFKALGTNPADVFYKLLNISSDTWINIINRKNESGRKELLTKKIPELQKTITEKKQELESQVQQLKTLTEKQTQLEAEQRTLTKAKEETAAKAKQELTKLESQITSRKEQGTKLTIQIEILQKIVNLLTANNHIIDAINSAEFGSEFFIKQIQAINELTTQYADLKKETDEEFKPVIEGRPGKESSLKLALDVSRTTLSDFFVNHYAAQIQTLFGQDVHFAKAIAALIGEIIDNNQIVPFQNLCIYLEEQIHILEKNRVVDNDLQETWIAAFKNNFYSLITTATDATKPLTALSEAARKFAELKDNIKQHMQKNAYTADASQYLASAIKRLQNQHDQFQKNIAFLRTVFSETEIAELQQKADKDYTETLYNLLANINTAVSSIPRWTISEKRKDCEANDALIQTMESLTSLSKKVNALAHKESDPYHDLTIQGLKKLEANLTLRKTEHRFANSRIVFRETAVDELLNHLSARGSFANPPLAKRLENQFIQNLSKNLTNYRESGDSSDLKSYLAGEGKKYPNAAIQSFIKQVLVVIEDVNNLPKDQVVGKRAAVIAPFTKNTPTAQIQTLYNKLQEMKDYGESSSYGKHQPTVDLANALTQRLNTFVAKNQTDINAGNIDLKSLQAFQKVFKLHLHTQDHEMHNNRGFFSFFKVATTRSLNIAAVESALDDLLAQEPSKSCIFW